MFTPAINQPCFVLLYGDHSPIKVMVNAQLSDDSFNISIFDTRSQKFETDSRDITVGDNGFRFFDAPMDAPYHYCVVQYQDNSYDAINVNDVCCYMDIEEALKIASVLDTKHFDSTYEVVVRKN